MKAIDYVINRINRLPVGYVFTYNDIGREIGSADAVTKALGRLVEAGKIRKLSPGRFYKSRITDFGELKPDIYQVVKDLIEVDGKNIGYLTGYFAYNILNLTTQVSSVIHIGICEPKKNLNRGMYKIKFVKQPNRITRDRIPCLQILDSIRTIKEIPGTTADDACRILDSAILKLRQEERLLLASLALKYNPATRALTGAILENIAGSDTAAVLYKSLNPSSTYSIGLSIEVLPNKIKWGIE